MDRKQAMERAKRVEEKMAAAQAEMAQLRKIIDTQHGGSLLTKPEPGSGEDYWILDGTAHGGMRAIQLTASVNDLDFYEGGVFFTSVVQAKKFAEAVNTMLLLRHQPGTEPAVDNAQYLIEMMRKDDKLRVKVIGRTDAASKMNKLSPCFDTFVHAVEAVETLGMPRLQCMFKTLHGIED